MSRLEPGLHRVVMHRVRAAAVVVRASRRAPVDDPEAPKRGGGEQPVREHDSLVRLEPPGDESVEYVLIGIEKWIRGLVSPPVRPAEVNSRLKLAHVLEQP